MLLSVVVTIVDGGGALQHCLRALADQDAPPFLEVVVPWDASVVGIPALQERFPAVRFVAMGRVATSRPVTNEAGRHELYDRRRAAGLAAAEGAVVAMLEDRGAPRRDWARKVVDLHRRFPHAVIGGAIENAVLAPWNRALWFCDFGRYQLPLAAGPAAQVSDTNVSYKREALWSVHGLWRERYHEPAVHGALRAAGKSLFLSPEIVVDQRRAIPPPGALLAERFHWARRYAAARVQEGGLPRRLVLVLGAPFLPVLLLLRQLMRQLDQRRLLGAWLRCAPRITLLLLWWSAGELWGYVTRRG
jgi:hypothetical protein